MSIMEELKEKIHKLEYLPKKIDNIEYKEIKELKDKIENIEVDLAKNNLLTKQNTEAMEKMSQTMDSVRETMVQISGAIEYTSKTNQELAENIRQQNEKIDRLQTRQDTYDEHIRMMQKEIDENEEKSKIDIRLIIKKYIIQIIALIIAIGSYIGVYFN